MLKQYSLLGQVCRKIDNCPDGTSILQRIFDGVSVYYNYTGTVDCFNLDDDPDGVGTNGWNWQVQNCDNMIVLLSILVKLYTS